MEIQLSSDEGCASCADAPTPCGIRNFSLWLAVKGFEVVSRHRTAHLSLGFGATSLGEAQPGLAQTVEYIWLYSLDSTALARYQHTEH